MPSTSLVRAISGGLGSGSAAYSTIGGVQSILTLFADPTVTTCFTSLILLGILCAAAGIGGGGIIVSVLMNFGGLSPYDSVPLSKAVVFFGSVVSLALNYGKKLKQRDGDGETSSVPLIDWPSCRVVVPMSLIGTLIGVLLNRQTPGWGICCMLVVILTGMTVMVATKTLQQYREEQMSPDRLQTTQNSGPTGPTQPDAPEGPPSVRDPLIKGKGKQAEKGAFRIVDMLLLSAMLCFVVSGGVLRHRAEACDTERALGVPGNVDGITDSKGLPNCAKSALGAVFGSRVGVWMMNPTSSRMIHLIVVLLPIWACLTTGMFYGVLNIRDHNWKMKTVMVYQTVAVGAGVLAGLVGIGGGLIFSPFFLLYGVEPSVAIATSATCVLFTSSSTTVQYLLTGRVEVMLALIYGVANAVASAVGTSLVHKVQDRFDGRRSYISAIVVLAVAVSAGLSMMKMVQLLSAPPEIAV